MQNKKLRIIKDTREKVGSWSFAFADNFENERIGSLKTGDYTLEGYEEVLCIERKRTVGEIAINLGKKWKTFEKELERMLTYKYKYIICEFSAHDVLSFPVNSNIPPKLWSKLRMNGKYIMKKLNEIKEKYQVEIIFCDDKYTAEQTVIDIFNNVISN